ncbi:Toll/interleukin-1 receptor homology (TIR) domain [Arabidopsis suecica]|uniref:Auxin response factor n=1 Tax=Arabidopsis suecica TaxID=45249 RepID=A0A8T1YM00_ARASU|nr:Toll/interleukin-1 receptor homology (TIR) domain [Arabidopsis suecica]
MEQERSLEPQLWHACAGSMVQIPTVHSKVFYFAQGHTEHAHAPPDFHAPRVPPLVLCRVVAVKFLADAETDDLNAKIRLLPLPENDLDLENDTVVDLTPPKPAYFVKTLKNNDVNKGAGFSVPRRWAEKNFPPLDVTAKCPYQTLIVKDIRGKTWKFRHIRGTPRRHMLTTGWSTFVEQKKLIAGDSIVFLRYESGDLYVGVRRTKGGGGDTARRVTVEAVTEAVERAACGLAFEVVYYPQASTPAFCVKAADVRAAMRIKWCSGMRFKMIFEAEGFSRMTTGTVSTVQVVDPIRWPNSPWRLLEVVWDKPELVVQKVKRVSPWLVELVSDMPADHLPPFSHRKKIQLPHLSHGVPSAKIPLIATMNPQDAQTELITNWRAKVVESSTKVDSEKSRSKQQIVEDNELAFVVTKSLSDAKRSRSTEGSGESGSGSIITTVAGKPSTITLNMRSLSYPNDDLSSFCEFLSSRLPPLDLSGCRAEDAIDFLRMQQASGDVEALVGRLSAACEVFGIKPQDNPFHNVAVTAYLKAAKEMTQETECILVFSCNDKDVDETLFIETISKKLQEREVTPLIYNLSWRKDIDTEIFHRFSVGIMVLSHSYTCTRQSMDHLVAILEHWKAKNLVIIPIYFKVTLLDICGLEGRFEAAFLQYLNSAQPGSVQKWKAALAEIASMDGHEWTKETQDMLAEEVVRNACLKLYLKNSKNLVRILALLNHSQPSDADIVGIWGMAGIGKTSIAREIFGILAPRYDVCYFLQDFYLMCQKKGLRQIRDDFFSKVFGEDKLSISAYDLKPSFMRDWFHNKTIFVVLDDVSNARDAEAVVGGFGWFSHGHRIILTSRRKQVLVQCKVKESYEIQKLCETESFRLCKQFLNGESVVISELISCSSGIPLALQVLGSSVSKQPINNMKEHLQRLRRNPPTQIQKAFRRSFDGIDENEKNIFLDLACFFRGESKDHVVQLLDACGFLTYLGICDLIDESLISLVDNRIEVPVPFQDIGRYIVHEEDEDPCGRSRLWDSNDIVDVLTNNSGTEAIEGIFLNASDLTCELSPTVFDKMYKLRLLKFYCSTSGNQCMLSVPQGLNTLPDELRLLHWENYPLKYLPQKFNPENLVEVNMPYSYMEMLWEGKKNLEKLKKINLSHSRNLTDILMLSEALNLEYIDLEGCTSLVDISASIPRCGKLVSLNMKDCSRLRSLPSMVDLTSLKLLNVSGCLELEEIQDLAPNLKELYLAGTAIRELPLSIENLAELTTLDLENCKSLQQLPFGIKISKSIVKLKLFGCTSLGLISMGAPLLSHFRLRKRKRLSDSSTHKPRKTAIKGLSRPPLPKFSLHSS